VLDPLKFLAVIRVLGIYTMDQLKRTDWDKLGKYKARKDRTLVEKYVLVKSSKFHEITPSRCKLRAGSGCSYFDPVTFHISDNPVGTVSGDPGSFRELETEGLDEVLSHPFFCNFADAYPHRFINC
jgi:hypothetical protein